MSKEKQIDEVARIIDDNHGFIVSSVEAAKALYNAGYRKQIEGEWIAVDNCNGKCSIIKCSNCLRVKGLCALSTIETVTRAFPYCEKCGAKMKGGVE